VKCVTTGNASGQATTLRLRSGLPVRSRMGKLIETLIRWETQRVHGSSRLQQC